MLIAGGVISLVKIYYLLLYKTACVVCCVLWLYFHRYLLCKYKKSEAVVVHADPKSATLGPRLIFISKF